MPGGSAHPAGQSSAPALAAADFRPGSVAALSRMALTGEQQPGATPGAVRRSLAVPAVHDATAGADIAPASRAMMSSGAMRLSVIPLPAQPAPSGPGHSPAAPATASVLRSGAPGTRTAMPPSSSSRPVVTPQTTSSPAAQGAPALTALPGGAPAVTPLVRRKPLLRREATSAGSGPHTAIRPATVDLLRSARVAAPQGIFATSSRGGAPAPASASAKAPVAPSAPPPPPSVAGSAEDSVIHRFFQGRQSLIGAHRAPQDAASQNQGTVDVPGGRRRSNAVSPGSGGPGGVAPWPGASASPQQGGSGQLGDLGNTPDVRDALSSREWAQLVDEVTRRIEARVSAELARRGRRTMPRPM